MESVSELGCFRSHNYAGAEETEREPYCGSTLLDLPLDVLQGGGVVNGIR